jgi:hypothetical protein
LPEIRQKSTERGRPITLSGQPLRITRGERADHTLCRTLRLPLSNELAAKWCTKETVAPVNAEGCCSVANGPRSRSIPHQRRRRSLVAPQHPAHHRHHRCTAVLGRFRVERRANGDASSVMRMELRAVGGRLGGGEVVWDCRWRTCMDVQGWNRAAAFVERRKICARSEPVADRTTDAVDLVAGPPSCRAVPHPRPALDRPDQDAGAELALWLPATWARIGSGSGG